MSDSRALENLHASGLIKKRDLCIVRGEGAILFDDAGKAYIDCVGGQGVSTLGHGNQVVAEAIAQQARILITCQELFYNDRRAEFLGALRTILPGDLERVFLCNSGAEAVEGALKLARLSTGRTKIVSTVRGFHGRTFGALSATHEPKYREAFLPLVPDFSHVAFNKVEALEGAIDDNTAAFIVEAIQGEGGVNLASDEYLRAAHDLTRKHGALLIVDEIQTGFGRTGRWFGCDHAEVVPDLMTMGKAIAGGVPMGAVAIGPRVQNIAPGLHGTTFGGNPLACAAGIASLSQMKMLDIPSQAEVKGLMFMQRLGALDSPVIREVRGKGLLIGIELKVKVAPILRQLEERGVLALPAGMSVLRLLPPAVISEAEIETVVTEIEAVLKGFNQ